MAEPALATTDFTTQLIPRRTSSIGLTQAYELRELAHKFALELTAIDAAALSFEAHAERARALQALANVWDIAQDRIRIIKGRPLPGSYRPERKAKVSARAPFLDVAAQPVAKVKTVDAEVLVPQEEKAFFSSPPTPTADH